MCPNKSDINNPIGIVDPDYQPILVAGNIEHHSAIFENTGIVPKWDIYKSSQKSIDPTIDCDTI